MVSDRPYRDAIAEKEARERLLTGAGSQFDPAVVEAFLRVLERLPLAVVPNYVLHRASLEAGGVESHQSKGGPG